MKKEEKDEKITISKRMLSKIGWLKTCSGFIAGLIASNLSIIRWIQDNFGGLYFYFLIGLGLSYSYYVLKFRIKIKEEIEEEESE